MINIKDRVVATPHRYQMVPVSGQTGVYDLVAIPGTVTEAGTTINRSLLLALQGFHGNTTVFNPDGSITETNAVGDTKLTTFGGNTVVEKFTSGALSITKTITFNGDGSISEVIS